ncbi:MAG: DegT/DnrJ/EryC1/StrS family aminotransferase [Muribaculaceae bacterium]|nr:DegT/DnrJ/EryC1/StrS family aminotransferase [Muribaculaceae bacterium]
MKKYVFLDLARLNAPYLDEMKAAACRVIDSGRYIGGKEVEDFENELAAYVGTRYAVGVSNGLDALRLIIRAYKILGRLHEGDYVALPANTYIASALAVTDNGLNIVAIRNDENYNLDSKRLSECKDVDIKAVMPVHLYGRTCWDSILQQTKDNAIIVEDNAQGIGATTADGRKTGSLGHAAAISFYPTKNLGALGDAGAVTTDDEEIAAIVRALANYGSDRRYHNIYQGFNCRLDPIQAAMLRVKLRHIDEENARRQAVADVYCSHIENKGIILPANDGRSVWHQFVVGCVDRDGFRRYLAENGVETDVNYPLPFFNQPCYSATDIAVSDVDNKVTAELCDSIVSLPIAHTTLQEAHEISEIINRYKAS